MLVTRDFGIGTACLIGAGIAAVGFVTAPVWLTPGSSVRDWLASCAIALAFAAMADGLCAAATRGGRLTMLGAVAVLALLAVAG